MEDRMGMCGEFMTIFGGLAGVLGIGFGVSLIALIWAGIVRLRRAPLAARSAPSGS
jgi:hypothetical protein